MTCIAGLVQGDRVLIAGDSAGVNGWSLTVRADQKVWASDGWVFGFTTSLGEAVSGFDAVGCGADVALGALQAAGRVQNPGRRLRTALRAAESLNAGVRGPFSVAEAEAVSDG